MYKTKLPGHANTMTYPRSASPDATMMALQHFKVQEILHNVRTMFYDDFEVSDIPPTDLRLVFTQSECDDINRHATESGRIDQLFHFLSLDLDKFEKFVNTTIINRYAWLSTRMSQALKDTTTDEFLLNKLAQVRHIRLDIPRLADYNVHRHEYLYVLKKKLKLLKRNEYLVLIGNLAYGKQWLALDACGHYEVLDCMKFNIFVLNLRNCINKEDILDRMKSLSNQLGFSDLTHVNGESESTRIAMHQILLKQLNETKYQECLVVLADVQNVDTFKAFRGLNCKMLITTRNKELLDHIPLEQTKQIDICHGFEKDETLQLFSKVLGVPVNAMPEHWSEIHHLCKGNPFLISLVASNLKKFNGSSESLKVEKWDQWVETLKKYESTKHKPFMGVVERSLQALTDEQRRFFEDFAIFSDNIKIPVTLLEQYWKKSTHDVETILDELDALYLVEMIQCDRLYCSIQYHYCSYLSDTVSAERKLKMHQRIVESYGIIAALTNRTEPNFVCHRLNDRYFYFFIGHHLKMAGKDEFMPKLYLDIGFLEQKLRATGLSNTIGDLTAYRDKIIGGEKNNELLLDELLMFLPSVEEMLKKSMDTSLLQYAISADGRLQSIATLDKTVEPRAAAEQATKYDMLQLEALRQADQFKHRVFFIDIDHIYHHRQIMKLNQEPLALRFIDANIAIIANLDNSIWLNDMSLTYSIEPAQFVGHMDRICELLLLRPHHFVTLDVAGICKLWSFQLTPLQRRRQSRSRSASSSDDSHRSVRQSRTESFIPKYKNTCLKSLDNSITRKHKLTCLLVTGTITRTLYGGTETGQILRAIWNTATGLFDDFTCIVTLKDVGPILSIVSIGISTLMVLTRSGQLFVFMCKSASFHIVPNVVDDISLASSAVKMFLIERQPKCRVVIVFSGVVMMLTLPLPVTPPIKLDDVEIVQLYATDDIHTRITCCVLSTESRHLVLGTSRGIVVYDVKQRLVTLRSSVTDVITCLDIYALDSDMYKYRLMCATENHREYIYLYGVEEADSGIIRWAPDRMGSPIDDQGLLGGHQLGTWLLGGRQFDACVVSDEAGDFWRVVAIDSKGRYHQYQSQPQEFAAPQRLQSSGDIGATCVSMLGSTVLVGCDNGDVLVNSERAMMRQDGAIMYVKLLTPSLWLVGTEKTYSIQNGELCVSRTEPVLKAFLCKEKYVIVVKRTMAVEIYDSTHNTIQILVHANVTLVDADLVDDCLVLSTTDKMQCYTINLVDQSSKVVKSMELAEEAVVTCVKLSAAKEYVAIGFANGLIRVHTMANMNSVVELRSHRTAVKSILFAPWTSTTSAVPVILVSVAEELCFWNLTWAINNPTDIAETPLFSPHSHHYDVMNKSTTSSNSTSSGISCDDSSSSNDGGGINGIAERHSPWLGKRGPSVKPELLSCIKVVGNRAESIYANAAFDTFLTIDDEGEIYFLRHCDVTDSLRRLIDAAQPPTNGDWPIINEA